VYGNGYFYKTLGDRPVSLIRQPCNLRPPCSVSGTADIQAYWGDAPKDKWGRPRIHNYTRKAVPDGWEPCPPTADARRLCCDAFWVGTPVILLADGDDAVVGRIPPRPDDVESHRTWFFNLQVQQNCGTDSRMVDICCHFGWHTCRACSLCMSFLCIYAFFLSADGRCWTCPPQETGCLNMETGCGQIFVNCDVLLRRKLRQGRQTEVEQ
jgi:hypothetical protein